MQEELRNAVIAYTSNVAYQAVKPAVIAERLGLVGDAATELRKTIKKMIRADELEYGPNHLVLPIDPDHPSREGIVLVSNPEDMDDGEDFDVDDSDVNENTEQTTDSGDLVSSNDGLSNSERKRAERREKKKEKKKALSKYITGTFRRVGSGDGFVRPEGTPAAEGKDLDIYVHAKNSGDAASGDMVRIVLGGRGGPKGKREGKLADIVERATNQFVGTYFESGGMGMVRVDGRVFGEPVYVGDPGAKGAKEDDKVVLEMVRFPSHVHDGEGVITKILGEHGQPGVDTMAIKYEFGLPGEFPEDVIEDSRKQADAFNEEELAEDRRDLREEVVITIDPATARDFDDAISLKKIKSAHSEEDHWELGVHIADVSHFVQPKTPLDREAYDRATSVYLPDEVIPMLPEVISNNLASLQPDKVRYAMTALIEFTPDGLPIGCEVFKSAIKSRRRFTYEEVDQYLNEKELVKHKEYKASETTVSETLAPEVDELLGNMFSLAMALRKRRFERGSLELHMPEVKVDLDDDGRVCGASVSKNTESHQVIEEFMLAANEAVARRLADAGLIFLRRLHGDPDPRKSKALTEFIRSLGLPADNLQDRFELQALLGRVKGDPRSHAVNFATLRSMQKAVYGPDDGGHYALASECYCHFTSPIRRYPDLTIHRLINALNAHQKGTGPKPVQEMGTYLQWGDHCSEREQRASVAERELTKVKLLNFLSDKIGMELEGVITGVENFGVFVMGRDLPAEGFIHITALGDDYYKHDRASHTINGFRSGNTFRLGDTVKVAVASVDIDARQLDFKFLGRGKSAKQGSGKKSSSKKRSGESKEGSQAKGSKPGKEDSGEKAKSPAKSRRSEQGKQVEAGKKKRPSRGKNTLRKKQAAESTEDSYQSKSGGKSADDKGSSSKGSGAKGKASKRKATGKKTTNAKTDKTGKQGRGKKK